MQFLKILFWCLLAFVAAVFTFGNWTNVEIRLWGGLIAEINLPLLLFVTFMCGLLPTLAYHHVVRWRLRRRLGTTEAILDSLHAPIIRDPSVPAAIIANPPAIVEVQAIPSTPQSL